MVRAGVLTPEQAAVHPMRNVITRAVGSDRSVQVDILTRERKAGDLWLFCSDGLHGQVEEQEIVEYLHLPIAQAADALLKAAMDAGAPDNVSLVLVLDKGDEA
jgi:protein phosphatase